MNRKELVIIAVGIFLTIVAWMILDIYHIQSQETLQSEIQPISIREYNIDTSAFDKLEQKNGRQEFAPPR